MKTLKDRSTQSWVLYDWANSVFSTTVMAGFFPVFFKQYWSDGIDATTSTAYLGFANAISAALIALALPLLGAIADVRPWKKELVFLFTVFGSTTTMLLGFVGKGAYVEAAILYALAAAAFNGACSIYDSLLPSVSDEQNADTVSAFGYALGYLGGGILFTVNILMYRHPEWFGLAAGVDGIRWSFFTVALWWVAFSIPMFLFVRELCPVKERIPVSEAFSESIRVLKGTVSHILHHRPLLYFMIGYWLYIDGVYSVVKMAIDYGVAIGFQSSELIVALLVTQYVGFPAAIVYSALGRKYGTRRAILVGLAGYMIVVVWASLMSKPWEFYALAVFIGLVQGGVQALSRSYFVKLIPADRSGEYFGLLNLVGRFSSIFGPALVGTVALLTESSRLSMASLLVLFVGGAFFLLKVEESEKTVRVAATS